jgi:hypothetical protein
VSGGILECGHVESPHSEYTTGYGTDAQGKRHCYNCCTALDLATMRDTGRIDAYLSSDGETITTWPGGILARVTSEREGSAGGFLRGVTVTRVDAIADDGSLWYGRGPGRGMYIRLRRTAGAR